MSLQLLAPPKHSIMKPKRSKSRFVRQVAPYPCCRIISAFNALAYFGLPAPPQEGIFFEYLIDVAKCRHGSALDMESVHMILGIDSEPLKTVNTHILRSVLGQGKPIELFVFSPDWGFHSVLLVDLKDDGFMVANWNKSGTIFVRREILNDSLPSKENINRRAYVLSVGD